MPNWSVYLIVTAALLMQSCSRRENALNDSTPQDADIALSASNGPAAISAGGKGAFHVLMVNKGPQDARQIGVRDTVGNQSKLLSITCQAHGKAVCPSVLGPSMVVPSLPKGDSLEFVITVALINDGTGTIVNSMSADVSGDNNPNDNSVTSDIMVR